MAMNSAFWRFCEWFYVMPKAPPRERTEPMQVLCVGFPRSGTESLQNALLMLGYDYTYHGWDILFEDPPRTQEWVKLARKKWFDAPSSASGEAKEITAAEFDAVLGHSVAITDAAGSCFAREVIQAYPDAKVILNVRDIEKWHASAIKNLCDGVNNQWSLWILAWFDKRLWWSWHVYERFLWRRLFRCPGSTLQSGIVPNGKAIYQEHCAMIRGLVQPERLLVWDVEDGWEPLCRFLGKDVPKEPFPSTNDAAGFQGRLEQIMNTSAKNAVKNMLITFTVLVGAASVGWWKVM